MDNSVNILYQCDNNYAPFMGVSLTSLLMNTEEKLYFWIVMV